MKTKKSTNLPNDFPDINKPEIYFFTENTKFVLKNKKRLKLWIGNTFIAENKPNYSANVIFCNDEFLYALNLKYLKHNTYTDIITFDYSDSENIIGDIYISVERVKENAKKYQISFIEELSRVIIHGVLHLCGYKDKEKTAKKLMTEKEDYYLSLL